MPESRFLLKAFSENNKRKICRKLLKSKDLENVNDGFLVAEYFMEKNSFANTTM
jgi:hypothetical protein